MTRQEPLDGLPGWYEHPHMYRSLCWWDGDDWTDKTAPMPTELSLWAGVRIVALGTMLGTIVLALLLFALTR